MSYIVLASNNKHKIKEFGQILNTKIVSMIDVGFVDEIVENGTTAKQNAIIKAKTLSKFLQSNNIFVPVLADDSGLSVDCLNGEPGIYSARYSGEHGNDQANRDKLLNNLKDKQNRKAHFFSVVVKYYPNESIVVGEGKVCGSILTHEQGDTSFGYDCIFYSDELGKSFGEATPQEKNSVSHRARAIKDLINKDKN